MPRQARKESKTGYYHIMTRGINKEYIFNDKFQRDMIFANTGQTNTGDGTYCFKFDTESPVPTVSPDILMKMVKKHTNEEWIILYIQRWLTVPFHMEDGTIIPRTSGTPQGGVISPVLANLFLHYVYDDFMVKEFETIPWARYADDGVTHCVSLKQAEYLLKRLQERFEEINNRESIGHWEMDCVVSGRGSKAVLLVLTERKSRKNLIYKMKDKTQASVAKVLDKLERKQQHKFKQIFKSITMDNGCEFVNQDLIEKSVLTKKKRTTAYYAHPYSSWERGSNENANKIIRRFIPKGSDISLYTEKEIRRIEQWINNYPRKILKYKSAIKVYEMEMAS